MAITFVAAGTAKKVGSGSLSSIPVSAGIAANDVLVIAAASADNKAFGTPTGWTKLGGGTPASALQWAVYTKITTGTESAPSVSHTAGDDAIAQMYAWRGCSGAPTIIGTGVLTGSSVTISANSITTTVAGSVIVFVGVEEKTNDTSGAPQIGTFTVAGLTFAQVNNPTALNEGLGANQICLGVAWATQTSAGATGAGTATVTGENALPTSTLGVLLAIPPAASGSSASLTASPGAAAATTPVGTVAAVQVVNLTAAPAVTTATTPLGTATGVQQATLTAGPAATAVTTPPGTASSGSSATLTAIPSPTVAVGAAGQVTAVQQAVVTAAAVPSTATTPAGAATGVSVATLTAAPAATTATAPSGTGTAVRNATLTAAPAATTVTATAGVFGAGPLSTSLTAVSASTSATVPAGTVTAKRVAALVAQPAATTAQALAGAVNATQVAALLTVAAHAAGTTPPGVVTVVARSTEITLAVVGSTDAHALEISAYADRNSLAVSTTHYGRLTGKDD